MEGYDLPKGYEVVRTTCGTTDPDDCCPTLIRGPDGDFYIIGERVELGDVPGLERKIGDNELVVKVPKNLIDHDESSF
jgi:hypothetical protein